MPPARGRSGARRAPRQGSRRPEGRVPRREARRGAARQGPPLQPGARRPGRTAAGSARAGHVRLLPGLGRPRFSTLRAGQRLLHGAARRGRGRSQGIQPPPPPLPSSPSPGRGVGTGVRGGAGAAGGWGTAVEPGASSGRAPGLQPRRPDCSRLAARDRAACPGDPAEGEGSGLGGPVGKALLERNQDMSRQYERMHKELTDKLEVRTSLPWDRWERERGSPGATSPPTLGNREPGSHPPHPFLAYFVLTESHLGGG